MTKQLLVVCTLFLFVAGCSKVTLTKLDAQSNILAFGDSLTIGKGVTIEHSYPSILSELIGFDVINAGVSGETTAQGVDRFKTLIDKHQPQLTILLEGGNDFLRNVPKHETKHNLSKMIRYAKSKHSEIILISVPQKSLFLSTSPIYAELAKEHDVVLISGLISKLLKDNKLKSDSIHFNKLGYQKLAESIYEKLSDLNAI